MSDIDEKAAESTPGLPPEESDTKAEAAQGPSQDESDAGSVMDSVRQTRSRTLTDRGREYQLDVKVKRRNQVYKKLCSLTGHIKSIMIEEVSEMQMQTMFSHWLTLYEQFLDVHEDYCALLASESELEVESEWFADKNGYLLGFKTNMESWFAKVSAKTVGERFSEAERELDNLMNIDVKSKSSRHSSRKTESRASSKGSSVLSARLLEAERMAELKARADMLNKKQQLEEAKLRIKIEEEQIQIQSQLAASTARSKVLDQYTTAETVVHKVDIHSEPKLQPKQTVPTDVIQSRGMNTSAPPFIPGVRRDVSNPRYDVIEELSRQNSAIDNVSARVRHRPLETPAYRKPPSQADSDNSSNSAESVMVSVIRQLKKPTTEIKKFGGDPLDYKKFMRQFKSRVMDMCEDNDERLNYLEQYTFGEAHKIVSGYGFLDANVGFNAALNALSERYGDSNVIVQAYVKKALNWPIVKSDNAKALDEFCIFLSECFYAVQNTEAMRVLEFPDNMRKIVAKLPAYLHVKWRNVVQSCREQHVEVTFDKLVDLIKVEAKKVNDPLWGREAMCPDKEPSKKSKEQKSKNPSQKGSFTTSVGADSSVAEATSGSKKVSKPEQTKGKAFCTPCMHCDGQHVLAKCRKLTALPFTEKSEVIKLKGLCFGCLRAGHQKVRCQNKASCDVCGKLHPSVLHDPTWETARKNHQPREVEESPKPEPEPVVSLVAEARCADTGAGECTMAIVPVKVRVNDRLSCIETYAFLDPGSSVTFCSERLMTRLGASGKQKQITVRTLGQPHKMSTTIINGLEVCDLNLENIVALPPVYTKEEIPVSKAHIPTNEDLRQWPHLNDVTLPQIDAEIDLLIGNNVPDVYTPTKVVTGPQGAPHAVRTAIGWIAWNVVRGGQTTQGISNCCDVTSIEELQATERLENLVHKSMNLDFPEQTIDDEPQWSQEDRKFMEKVKTSMSIVDGHYQLPLPFRNDNVCFPDNRSQAISRLKSLKKKLETQTKFHEDYTTFMSAVIEKGYAEPVPDEELARSDGKVWYIPHHGVYHPKKPEKIRVVFDCAAEFQGISLNQLLLPGPNLTSSLLGVLLRFRKNTIALTSDIESMFYQVRVPSDDCDCLRFFWWPNGDVTAEVKVYRMVVHLFGAASSPSCANVALRQTAIDHKEEFPSASHAILNHFYVDDFLYSVPSEAEAIDVWHEVSTLCQRGGFHLTKWISSSCYVLDTVPVEERAKGVRDLDLDHDDLPMERALGVSWSVQNDAFGFSISLKSAKPTRRSLLSIISSVFDPMGFVSPVTLQAKMILQELCRQKTGWDDPIDDALQDLWQRWLEEVPLLSSVDVKRCLIPPAFDQVVSRDLHVFCDASEKGYGVVIYLRVMNQSRDVYCSILFSSSRVAPLKKVTIPRLELTAASLAVKLAVKIKKELHMDISATHFWTDSMTVLRYIANDHSRFKTFVANRVVLIREGSDIKHWHYIESKKNPADCASRGMSPSELLESNWLKGPDFLWHEMYPTDEISNELDPNDDEVKASCYAVSQEEIEPYGVDKLLKHYSDWYKLKRAVSWILLVRRKLLQKIRQKPQGALSRECQTTLSVQLLDEAELSIVSYVQRSHFKEEVKQLQCDSPNLKRSSPLYRLDPMIQDGVLRVGGRLDRANLPFETKHPAILPKDSPIVSLILRDIHQSVGHLSRDTMLTKLRERRYKARVGEQKMADLPADRVTAGDPPFTKVGMDYFGPFEVKRGRSSVKRYGVIFTCLTTRAAHLEVAFSLDLDSCIHALRRFIARRGTVNTIYSDNGTNLVGAERELRRELEKWNSSRVQNEMLQKGITWVFNPPAASHFGGVWERMIRTVRKILFSLLNQQVVRLDDEALTTLLCEVEAILNSRPLTTVSSDAGDCEPLTPNHLLLLRSGSTSTCGVFDKTDPYARKRWRHVQYLSEMFWKRWSKEYLHSLQERNKWQKPRRNFQEGDVVLLVDSSPRNTWSLGRIIEIYPDRKGLVRSVKVKTNTGTYHRPVHKLCLIVEYK